ncbi:hypothetical protein [Micromonospora eburnea]|uniref:Uncharacterized protein n=1 Tax=Micromonospora eburnea TaxID=227316 RepID=A0A1C6TVW4_9ACTN|nr:hypothetical protein GA0070604_1153 [Micromonospora eburnea]
MRFVRTIAGMLLLAAGIPALLVGAVLWTAARHADPNGGFGARVEPIRNPGQAVVVTDVDDLLRAEAPFARTGLARLRLAARTPDGPAFLGLAPTDQVDRWLRDVPHAAVSRVVLARGPLPVRLEPAGPAAAEATAVAPHDQRFWVREGTGALEWAPAELADRPLSLVVMRPDGRADLTLDLRAEVRAGWLPGMAWALPAGGVLLVVLAVVLLLRPVRPREVVFVVEPDQVPVLAGRLGVTSLSGLGARVEPCGLPERQLVSVGAASPAERPRPALGPVPSRRPETLADLPAGRDWSWPLASAPETPGPVEGSVDA